MFQVMVDDAVVVHSNLLAVSGECKNRNELTKELVDEFGNVYVAYPAFGYSLNRSDSQIILGIAGNHDAESFKGKVLSGF
jgi:hypothetical protein